MEQKQPEQDLRDKHSPSSETFCVFTDEEGRPCFPDQQTPAFSDDCFVTLSRVAAPSDGDFVLVSTGEGLTFDRIRGNGNHAFLERTGELLFKDNPPLILGVVLSGAWWFAILPDPS